MAVFGREILQSVTLQAAEVIGSNIIAKFGSTKTQCNIEVSSTDDSIVGIVPVGGNTDAYLQVSTQGIELVKAGAVVTAGKLCMADTAGKGINGTDGNYVIGNFLASGNTDDLVPVQLGKGYLETT
jgi:hypothetical protein